jgi:molecular chaperone DnaK
MAGTFMGIDFGVTTTVTATRREGQTRVVEDNHGSEIIPSVVALLPTGKQLVGQAAKARRLFDTANTVFSFKRIIGEPSTSVDVRRFVEQYPFFNIDHGSSRRTPCFVTRAGLLTAEDVAAKLLGEVRTRAKDQGDTPDRAVVGIPSGFRERQRLATVRAVQSAGFSDALLIEEPLAIAWAFVHNQPEPERRIAVYDFGGGTFDLAICEVRGGGVRLLATGGDEYLGGDDLDRVIAEWVIQEVLQRYHWDVRSSHEAHGRLVLQCEAAKIALSAQLNTSLELDQVEELEQFAGQTLELSRETLDQLARDLVRRTFAVCDDVLRKLRLGPGEIDEVYLAGGCSLIPSVLAAVANYFGATPRTTAHPEHLVAIGTALIAERSNLT